MTVERSQIVLAEEAVRDEHDFGAACQRVVLDFHARSAEERTIVLALAQTQHAARWLAFALGDLEVVLSNMDVAPARFNAVSKLIRTGQPATFDGTVNCVPYVLTAQRHDMSKLIEAA